MKDTIIFTLSAILGEPTKSKQVAEAWQKRGVPFAVITYNSANEKSAIEQKLKELGMFTDAIFVRRKNDNRSIFRYVEDVLESMKKGNWHIIAVYVNLNDPIDKKVMELLARKKINAYTVVS